MFSSLNRFFEKTMAPDDDQDSGEHRLRIATCALLLEAANADDDFSDEERQTVTRLVGGRFKLSDAESSELIALAEQERQAQQDLYQFSRLINEHYTRPRKLAILELLWEVVYSDGVLAAHEDALMRKLGTLLGVRHEELIAVKLQVRKRQNGGT